ncbi:unnamed protein product [Phytophthora lilii]|uniref:Unnamed protein product n=1 Tax=Phytophthora lilii TaxID=2077276 RepID=A0A9W6TER1_9STRA|nr:unnamed protein product [Phytophthora lilii]
MRRQTLRLGHRACRQLNVRLRRGQRRYRQARKALHPRCNFAAVEAFSHEGSALSSSAQHLREIFQHLPSSIMEKCIGFCSTSQFSTIAPVAVCIPWVIFTPRMYSNLAVRLLDVGERTLPGGSPVVVDVEPSRQCAHLRTANWRVSSSVGNNNQVQTAGNEITLVQAAQDNGTTQIF